MPRSRLSTDDKQEATWEESHGEDRRISPATAGADKKRRCAGGHGSSRRLDDEPVCRIVPHHQAWHGDAANRTAGALRRSRWLRGGCHRQAVCKRDRYRQRELPGRDRRQGFRFRSVAGRGCRGRPDPQRQGRPGPGIFDAGDYQSGFRPMRAGAQAVHLHRRAVAALVLRPRRQPRHRFRIHLSLLLGS